MRQALFATLAGLSLLSLAGCPGARPTDQDTETTTTEGTDGTDGTTGTGTGTGATDATGASTGSVVDLALSFLGSLSGNAATLSTTKASQAAQSGHKIPSRALGAGAVGWLADLGGKRLTDANGNEYPEFAVTPNGQFGPIPGLPVGVDLLLNIDENGDGTPDLVTIINIPQDAGGDTGTLADTACDPLSTLIHAKLYALIQAHGLEPGKLGISASGLVERIRDAFEHLYAESGIDKQVTIDDLASLSDEQLAAFFDQIIPVIARRAMDMTEGNLLLAGATTVDEVVKAAARILVQSGFIVGDDPSGIDLSFLGSLPNVETLTMQQFMAENNPGATPPPGMIGPTIYRSTLGGFDRNFADSGAERPKQGGPLFVEHVLSRMADLYLAGKTLSLEDLYEVLVGMEGLGVRLTYMTNNGPTAPPLNVFETADGQGAQLNLEQLHQQLRALGLDRPDPGTFEQKKAQLRTFLKSFFAATVGPSFERLFAGILLERVPQPQTFAALIREARAHLPFSRSGPAKIYVLADGDPHRDNGNNTVQAITVDVTVSTHGAVTKVVYNASGSGKYYLAFGPQTEHGMLVAVFTRDTGRPLHSGAGRPQHLELTDTSIFQPINGASFFDFVSESSTGYPGAPALRVPNPGYNPDLPADPQTNPPDFQAFVMVDKPGPDAEPVRVNYDGGVATAAADGQWYLLFTERTPQEGLFALISESGEILEATPGVDATRVLVAATDVQGLPVAAQTFTNIYGIDVPNPSYDATGAPYFDDINNNGLPNSGEPSFDHRDFLFNANDWRSTRVDTYYRRADNNGFVTPNHVDWAAPEPRTMDGVALLPRNLKPRLNAFRFGNPNLTINLLTAFSPPDFFDGTHALNGATRVNPFTAIALLNLAFGSIHNVEAVVDFDGPGPMPPHPELIDAHVFVVPIGDPVQLMLDGFTAHAAAGQ
jgi:hypothetical protein